MRSGWLKRLAGRWRSKQCVCSRRQSSVLPSLLESLFTRSDTHVLSTSVCWKNNVWKELRRWIEMILCFLESTTAWGAFWRAQICCKTCRILVSLVLHLEISDDNFTCRPIRTQAPFSANSLNLATRHLGFEVINNFFFLQLLYLLIFQHFLSNIQLVESAIILINFPWVSLNHQSQRNGDLGYTLSSNWGSNPLIYVCHFPHYKAPNKFFSNVDHLACDTYTTLSQTDAMTLAHPNKSFQYPLQLLIKTVSECCLGYMFHPTSSPHL